MIRRLTTLGARRDACVVARRERASLSCTRVALDAPACGRSSSPLGRTQQHRRGDVDTSKYEKFKALDPFFNIVMEGLDGLVDGDHFWDAVADEAVFEFLYRFPGWPERLESRAAYMTAMESYGMHLNSADGLVVHLTRDPRVVVLEYEVHGTAPSTGRAYDNRFCSIVTIEDRKIVRWRDYMDSLAPVLSTSTS
jgi:ketosteroid isomerase-like protein